MKVEMVRHTEEPERMIARAARISHQSQGKGLEDDRRLIGDLLEWNHLSPLEFGDATFFVDGISRSCLAQLTRHRLASFMVRSMRYVEQRAEEAVIPPTVKDQEAKDEFRQGISKSFELYQKLLEEGIPKEDARFVLPIGSQTSLYIKANFREYRHIIKLRGGEEAQWEIRELALEMLDQLYGIAPSVFADLREEIDL